MGKNMKKTLFTLAAVACTITALADGYDLNKPFGFCTVSSRTDASQTYDITGGGCYVYPIPEGFTGNVLTLKSNGQDMKSTIQNAIKQNDVVILDGSDGDFIVSSNVGITTSNKTIIGINNARICTQWYVTDELKKALDDAGVPKMSTSGGGGTLPNGTSVKEEAEYNTRKIIIEMTGDNNEEYRKSGVLTMQNCQNIIIRNITFVGPGSIDVGGSDLISSTGAKHIWVDHCEFLDGMDGNFDITNSADFHTVSWCIFRYTDRAYMHQNTNLIGSSDSEAKNFLNTTFAFCWWGSGCKQRMPMARVGKVHMLNNYFTSTTASNGINPRISSEFLIDGNYIAAGMKKYYGEDNASAVTWTTNNYIAESSSLPASKGSTVTVPYSIDAAPCSEVPALVEAGAGATLPYGDSSSEPTGTKGSILWSLSSNANAEVSTALTSTVIAASAACGSNLVLNKYASNNNVRFALYQAQTIQTAAADDNAVTFAITVADGYQFKATAVEFYACKAGTDNGTIDVSWKDAGGKTALWTAQSPNRNKEEKGYFSFYTKEIENLSTATKGTCSLVINIYNVGANNDDGSINKKDLGLAQVIIKGTIIDGSTGISTPVIIKDDGNIYNLRGQKVTEDYKGIVIKNGKKYIQK